MRILLDGRRLTKNRSVGTLDASWRQLVPSLLAAAGPEQEFTILSATASPFRAENLQEFADQGAALAHQWVSQKTLAKLGQWGLSTESLAGNHDILHLSHPAWFLPSRARVVVSAQSLLFRHHPQFLNPTQVASLDIAIADMAHKASYWLCPSETTQADLIRHFSIPRGRTTVIPPGVSPRFQPPAELKPPASPYFLFLGSLEARKNLHTLLQGYSKALHRGLRADLWVAGPQGWGTADIQKVTQAFPALQEKVKFPGFIPEERLPTLFANSLAYVHPSRFEGAASTVLQAMATGRPIICANRAALPEIAGPSALTFHPDDAEALAEHLLKLEGDSALWKKLARASLDRAGEYSWERSAKATLQAYGQAMALPA